MSNLDSLAQFRASDFPLAVAVTTSGGNREGVLHDAMDIDAFRAKVLGAGVVYSCSAIPVRNLPHYGI